MASLAKIVVDASVVVKWYNIEKYTDNALRLRADYAARRVDLTAPYLLVYEIANSLRHSPDFGEEELKSAIVDLLGTQMNLPLLEGPQIQMASHLALRHGITFYDAAYLALAKAAGITLYTADDKLLTKVRDEKVRHLRDYRA